MNPPDATELRIEDHRTTLSDGAASEVVLTVGARGLAEALFRHDPPTPHEIIERAIDRVEDALAASGLKHADRGDLLTRDPQLHALLGMARQRTRLARDDVEAEFQCLASASLGHPRATAGRASGRDAAAALLILRECMHHLGFEGIRRSSG